MGDTINKLIQFISEDPIMLGLCIAIVVLIIIFILVLIFGGKKEKKAEKIKEYTEDNTQALLKTSLEEEPLRSTQEFNLNIGNNEPAKLEDTQSLENIQILSETSTEEDVPITVDEAIELKNQRQMEALKNTIEIPVLNDQEQSINENISIPASDREAVSNASTPSSLDVDNIPTQNINNADNDAVTKDESDFDIDLPKLKTESSSSIFDTLSGESFKIDNNH